MIARAKSVAARSMVMTLFKTSKPCRPGLTTMLRPTCDTEKMLESWVSRRKNVRLVAAVVGDRQS